MFCQTLYEHALYKFKENIKSMKELLRIRLFKRWTFFIVLCFILQHGYSQKFQDCLNPFNVCALKSYQIPEMGGHGAIVDAIENQRCFESQFEETNSFWFSWEVVESGILGFIIDPQNLSNDFDFVLFRSQDNGCNGMEEIRCVTTGLNHTDKVEIIEDCRGKTGLSVRSIDEFETAGCKYNDDNYVKLLKTETNEKYYLLVNNYDATSGFSIHFNGTTVLKSNQNCSAFEGEESLSSIHLYPNPARTKVNVEYMVQSSNTIKLEIIDVLGRKHKSVEIRPNLGHNIETIDISELANASYFVRLVQDQISIVEQFKKE